MKSIVVGLAVIFVEMGFSQVVVKLPENRPEWQFAVNEIKAAAKEKLTVVASIAKGEPESFRIRTGGGQVMVDGGDARGLMYGLLDVAEQLRVFHKVSGKQDKPFLKYRMLKFNPPLKGNVYLSDEDAANSAWFFDLDYWDAFFKMMAKARYNVISFWHSHPFGNMVTLAKYPEAALLQGAEMDKAKQFYHSLFQLAHAHGIDVYWMTWNIHVTPGFAKAHSVKDGQDSPLIRDYAKECMRETLREYPEIDGWGTCPGEAMGSLDANGREDFIRECILEPMRETGRKMPLIHRYWGAEPPALAKMVSDAKYPADVLLDIKFNGEHMYSSPKPHVQDQRWFNQSPKPYQILWHLRNDDLYQFNWGDPDFAYALIKNCAGSGGFVMGSEVEVPGVDRYHTKETEWHKTWKYQFEKHWFRWMLWGRAGYNPNMGEDVWRGMYQAKYGKEIGAKVYEATKTASKIIPAVERFHWDYMNGDWYAEGNIGGWNTSAEMPRPNFRRNQMWHDLDGYIFNNTIDEGMLSIPEMVGESTVSGKLPSGRKTAFEVAAELGQWSAKVDSLAHEAETLAIGPRAMPRDVILRQAKMESLDCDLMDLSAISKLGDFYAEKLNAAGSAGLLLFGFNPDVRDVAVTMAKQAADSWSRLADIADRHYLKHEVWLMGQFSWGMYTPFVQRDVEMALSVVPIPRSEREWTVGGKKLKTVTWQHVGDPIKDQWIDFMNGIAGKVRPTADTATTEIQVPAGRTAAVKFLGKGLIEASAPGGVKFGPGMPEAAVVSQSGVLTVKVDPKEAKDGFTIQVIPQGRPDDQIILPAKDGKLTAPFALEAPQGGLHGQCILVKKGVGHGKEGSAGPIKDNGWADFSFTTKLATKYEVWARVWFTDDDSNSFFLKFDGGDPQILASEDFNRWAWVMLPATMELKNGKHTLQVRNREDGVRLDEIRLIPIGMDAQALLPKTLQERLAVLGPKGAADNLAAYFQKMTPIKGPQHADSLEAWKVRRGEVREMVMRDIGLWPLPKDIPLDPHIAGSKERDGYTLSRIYLQMFPGCYGTGWLYVPLHPKSPKMPAIINPNGHFEHGAWNPTEQSRAIAMAKKGYVCIATDSIHAGDFEVGMCPIGLMTWQNIRALDYLCSRPDVDLSRIGITGASGGGQQTMYMMAIDDRLAAAVPVVMACYYERIMNPDWAHCWCNHAPGIQGDTDPIEYLSLFAPKPAQFESSTYDWTAQFPENEWKDVQKVWNLYGAGDKIASRIDNIPHDYDKVRREAMYGFFNKVFGVDDPDQGKEPALKTEDYPFMDTLDQKIAGVQDWSAAAAWYRANRTASGVTREKLAKLVRAADPVEAEVGGEPMETLHVSVPFAQTFLINGEKGTKIPAVLLSPKATARAIPAVILLMPHGKADAFGPDDKPNPLVQAILDSGQHVLAIDARLTGELQKDWVHNCLFWGRPEVGMAADDARWAAAYLAHYPGVDKKHISVIGVGHMGLAALIAGTLGSFSSCVFDAQGASYKSQPLYDTKGYYSGGKGLSTFVLPLLPGVMELGDVPEIAKACACPLGVIQPGEGMTGAAVLDPTHLESVAGFLRK